MSQTYRTYKEDDEVFPLFGKVHYVIEYDVLVVDVSDSEPGDAGTITGDDGVIYANTICIGEY